MSEQPTVSFSAELAEIAKSPTVRRLAVPTGMLMLAFAYPLYGLVSFALGSSLYSHVILIPGVSAMLAWFRRGILQGDPRPNRLISNTFAGLGGMAVLAWGALVWSDLPLATEDRLALSLWPLALFFISITARVVGRDTLRKLAFPLAMLFFMIPFPASVEAGIEMFFQHTSADAAYAFFTAAGTPVLRDGQILRLPGIAPLEVARECSGIHSSLVLFIVSLVAGDMMLHTGWKRVLLVVFVIPLGVLRNGFRIFVLGQLCVYDDPAWIHSPLHHRGGPIFFALSLIPLFLLLWLLWRSDRIRPDRLAGATAV